MQDHNTAGSGSGLSSKVKTIAIILIVAGVLGLVPGYQMLVMGVVLGVINIILGIILFAFAKKASAPPKP